jgi:hypothetical protein
MSPHLDLNDRSIDKEEKTQKEKDEKDNYVKLIKSHLEKKGKKKYWSNISRKADTNNDLI